MSSPLESEEDLRVAAALRNVPLPDRLRSQGLPDLFSEELIDRALRDVPCPLTVADVFKRFENASVAGSRRAPLDLRAAAQRLDLRSDTAPLVHEPVLPADRSRRAGGIPRRLLRFAVRGARDGLAVALVLMSFFGLFAVSTTASRWLSAPAIAARNGGGIRGSDRGTPAASTEAVVPLLVDGEPAGAEVASMPAAASAGAVRGAESGRETLLAESGRPAEPTGTGSPSRDGLPSQSVSPSQAVSLRGAPTGPSLAAPFGEAMRVVPARSAVGRMVPAHRGYDLAFEMTHGEPPFIDPSVAPNLAVDHPPLTLRTDSFDAAAYAMSTGGPRRERLRQAVAALRPEHVLAALPPEEEKVGSQTAQLRLTGYPSFSGRPSARLLEVCATAPPASVPPGAGIDVVFVLDASAAAGSEEAWPAVCRGVRDAAKRLDGRSRVSVVLFADRAVVVARRSRPRDVVELHERISRVRVNGGGDLHGCMPLVHEILDESRRDGRVVRCVVVAHAGSIARAERDGDSDLAAWRSAQATARDAPPSSLPMVVVAIDPASGIVGEAAARRGLSLVEGVGLDALLIRRRIVESATDGQFAASPGPDLAGASQAPGVPGASQAPGVPGASQTLDGCRLEVAFNPRHVAAYRLVGHRRNVVDMLSTAPAPIELPAGESVRVVYEVILRKEAPDAKTAAAGASATDVAKATFSWHGDGQDREPRITAGITSVQLALDPPSNDPRQWGAWLAVGVAEYAAGSPHVESPARLLETVRHRVEAWGGLADADPTLRRLVAILNSLAGSSVAGSGGETMVEFDAN